MDLTSLRNSAKWERQVNKHTQQFPQTHRVLALSLQMPFLLSSKPFLPLVSHCEFLSTHRFLVSTLPPLGGLFPHPRLDSLPGICPKVPFASLSWNAHEVLLQIFCLFFLNECKILRTTSRSVSFLTQSRPSDIWRCAQS